MELIDRKKLNKKKKYLFKTEYGAFPRSDWFFRYEDVMQAEVVDAVPVVRCKDCKWQNRAECPMYDWWTPEGIDEFFCRFGERKNG